MKNLIRKEMAQVGNAKKIDSGESSLLVEQLSVGQENIAHAQSYPKKANEIPVHDLAVGQENVAHVSNKPPRQK